ncbi:MAG: TatD family hydrolase [Lachnospiraceae bacterium]|nr:TatD family hydrolase [Lachnospiraceae bacterium]
MIFETHAHYDDDWFDTDRNELLNSMKSNGIETIVNVSSDKESIEKTIALTRTYPFIYGAVGIHPSDCGELEHDFIEDIRKASKEDKIVAIGEIGLDYYWDNVERDVQKWWFEAQMQLAREEKLPIIIHSREAAQDTMEMMKASKAEEIGGVVHCYSYSREMAKIFLDMGFYIGIGGVVTFKNAKKLKEVTEYVPLERIVIETDCPYLAPVPNRGKRNSSRNLPYVAQQIADIKGISYEEVVHKTYNNALALYRMEE